MKRTWKRLLIGLLASALLLAGCTSAPATPDDTTADTPTGTVDSTAEQTDTEAETEYDDPALALDHLTIGGVDISEYTIVVSAQPAPFDEKAAELLIRFISEATGVTLKKITDAESAEHMILIGTTAHDTDAVKAVRAEVTDDGYALFVENGHLYITGSHYAGTMNGTYDFLEKYVGWQLYGVNTYPEETELYEIKENVRVDVPADLRTVYNPALMVRMTNWRAFHECDAVFPLWNGFNPDQHEHLLGVHTIGKLAETGGYMSPQPCLTDENIYQTVLKTVRAQLAANPNATYISVSQNDSYDDNGCHCENCMAVINEEGSASGVWVRFVNRLANDIKDEYPNVLIETLAYLYTQKPPRHVKPAENVAIRLCASNACFAHALTDPDCPRNVEFSEYIKGWSEICDHLLIWDYSGNYAIDGDCGHRNTLGPNLRVMYDNVQFYLAHDVKYIYAEGKQHGDNQLSLEQGELRTYLWGRIMWNPTMSREEFDGYMNDFMRYYYGDAAPLILQYFDTMNNSLLTDVEKNEFLTGHTAPFTDSRTFFQRYDENGKVSTALVDELSAIWNQIDALDTLTDAQRLHTDCVKVQFYNAAADMYEQVAADTKNRNLREVAKEYENMAKEIMRRAGYEVS